MCHGNRVTCMHPAAIESGERSNTRASPFQDLCNACIIMINRSYRRFAIWLECTALRMTEPLQICPYGTRPSLSMAMPHNIAPYSSCIAFDSAMMLGIKSIGTMGKAVQKYHHVCKHRFNNSASVCAVGGQVCG